MLVIIRGEMVNPGEAALPEISHALSWQDHRLAPFISPNHPHYCSALSYCTVISKFNSPKRNFL